MISQSKALIVSDDPEFAQAILARWQLEREVPALTVVSSEVGQSAIPADYDLVVVGPVRLRDSAALLHVLAHSSTTVIAVGWDADARPSVQPVASRLLFLPLQDGWAHALVLLAGEALRCAQAAGRARQAEKEVAASQGDARLGRYVLQMRHGFNDVLTSVLGNAELLLLRAEEYSPQAREQLKTIHTMALRLNEMMQRFSSLVVEAELAETRSQGETEAVSATVASQS